MAIPSAQKFPKIQSVATKNCSEWISYLFLQIQKLRVFITKYYLFPTKPAKQHLKLN